MNWLIVWLVLLATRLLSMALTELDNSLVSEPEIRCNSDTIEMRFRTKHRFTGKIYVQGHYQNPDCRVDYSQTDVSGAPIGGIRLQHGACDMDRQRLIQAGSMGMQFSAVLMISFHPLFVTKADRAYHINCMYREIVQPVTAHIDVSEVPTQPIVQDVPLPTCQYTIRKDELDGPILHYANVGDQVVHRWECQSRDHGMLVHNCYVEDGQGEKRMVIDERGCHVDLVLGDPTYVKDLNLSYRESNVFKFADKIGVRFLCEIKLCLKMDGGCEGITPPICGNNERNGFQEDRPSDDWQLESNTTIVEDDEYNNYKLLSKRKRNIRGANKQPPPLATQTQQVNTVSTDLISQYVYVLDTTDSPSELSRLNDVSTASQRSTNSFYSSKAPVCLSATMFTSAVVILVLVVTVLIALLLSIHIKNTRMKKMPMEPPRRKINLSCMMLR